MRTERAAALTLALARTALAGYRAAVQSVTHDEALTFNGYLSHPWRDLYFRYDANNHLLSSILSKISISVFGLSEFTLRLPAVAAGFFLMWGVWHILEFAGSRAVRWIAFAAIGLHPLMLDFAAAARGYGLALALLAWALYAAMLRRRITSGILLGLAVCANFTAAFPAIGCIIASGLLEKTSWIPRLRTVAAMSISAAVPVVAICGGALFSARSGDFYLGFPGIRDSLFNLVYTGIFATRHDGLFGTPTAARFIAFLFLPAVVLFIAFASFRIWHRGNRGILIVPLTLALTALGIITAHYTLGLNYPIDRTGLALVLLFSLGWALAAGNTPDRLLRGANLLAACLLVIQFATQFHTSYFSVWWYDRSTKEIARRIAADCSGSPAGSVSAGVTWMHQPALEFYRTFYRIAALRPVERRESTLLSGQDYYVLNLPDTKSASFSGRKILFSDPFAGVVFAVDNPKSGGAGQLY